MGLILFLMIYSGCLLFSGCTGVEIPWVQWLQRQVVQGCLMVCQPVLNAGAEPDETGMNFAWPEGALQLVGAALDWPVVLEAGDGHGGNDYTGNTLDGAGNDTTREEEETGTLMESSEEEGEENLHSESIQNSEGSQEGENTIPDQSASEELPSADPISESVQNTEDPGTDAAVSAAVTPQVQTALLPAGNEIRGEILQLPAIAGLDKSQMLDFQYLLQKLYVVNSGCSVTEEVLNPRTLLSKNLTITHEAEGYEILVYHTHSQEAFADSAAGDISHTVVGLGDYLTTLLQEKGYRVLHHTGIYDMENGVLERDYAYDRALPVLEQILAENPSIQAVIDLHRDGVAEDVHLVADVNGEPTARLMFFNGMCRNETGERTDVTNPYREDNLAFSLQSALQLEAYYPGMLRVVYLKQSRYNQHLRSRSMLVEVGAQTNTVAEAYRTIPVLADILEKVLQ